MSVISVRLSDGIEQKRLKLDQLADRRAKQAIQNDLDQDAWQIAEPHTALCEADTGDFVSENEMNTKFKRWGN